MKKQAILGYLLFDQGSPVRRYDYKNGTWYFMNLDQKRGVSLFPDRAAALRVKSLLQRRYEKTSLSFDPDKGADQKRCFDLWQERMKSLRISCVVADDANPDGLRQVEP